MKLAMRWGLLVPVCLVVTGAWAQEQKQEQAPAQPQEQAQLQPQGQAQPQVHAQPQTQAQPQEQAQPQPQPQVQVQAQEGGTIRGTVYVLRSEPLPEALVEVVGTGLTATTNADGEFELRNVPPAKHELKITFPGYKDVTRPVELAAGETVSLEADLELDEQFGEEIVITGSKFGEKRLESPVTVEAVGSKLLMQSGSTSFMGALSSMKGIDYSDTGVNEKRISTRGFNTQFNSRMITMVDGRLAQLPGNGLPMNGQLPTPNLDVKAVEVVIGPASALYGANAHAGVINVLTKSPWDDPGAEVVVRGGTLQLVDVSTRVAGTVSQDFGYKVNAQFLRGRDFTPSRELPTHYYGGASHPLVFEGDLLEEYEVGSTKAEAYAYYRRGDWNFKAGYGFSLTDGVSMTNAGRNHLRGWQVHQQTVSASHPNWFAQVSRTYSNAGGTYQLDRLASVVQPTGGAPSDPSSLDEIRDQIKFIDESQLIDSEVQYQNQYGDLKFVSGLQLRLYNPSSKGTYLADVDGKKLSATEFGGYMQGDYSMLRDRLRLVAAARVDTHSNYSAQFSPKGSVVYSPARNQHLRVGYNRAFKSPTILENYLLISNILVGNRTGFTIKDAEGNVISEIAPLVPESVDSIEAGYKATFGDRLLVDVVAYHSWYRNFISALTSRANPAAGTFAFYPDGRPVAEGTPLEGTLSTYSNFGRSRVAGTDLGIEYMVSPNVTLNGSISYLKLLKFSNDDPTQAALLLNVPDLKLKASLSIQNLFVEKSFLRVFGRYQGAYEFRSGRWDSLAFLEDGKVPARFVADVSAGYSFSNGLAVSANVLNVFNDHGIDQLGAPQSGRMAYVQLAYKYSGLDY